MDFNLSPSEEKFRDLTQAMESSSFCLSIAWETGSS